MPLDFLRRHGARRVRDYDAQPLLLDDGFSGGPEEGEEVDHSYETMAADWEPHSFDAIEVPPDWPQRPVRFIDGKDAGRTVAWLQSTQGYPVPVRLAEIGAVAVRHESELLRREFYAVQRVLSLMTALFPKDEVREFEEGISAHGIGLLHCSEPRGGYTYDFERMRRSTQRRTVREMVDLERDGLREHPGRPAVVDGRLESHAGAFDAEHHAVLGLIKSHSRNYLHPQGWRVFYNLLAGQRTPALRIAGHNVAVVSWYVRLEGPRGELPNYGVVRLELAEKYFESTLGSDFANLDRYSKLMREYRCHDESYGRAEISIQPIQRAEALLGALFSPTNALINRFYHLTDL